MTALAKNVDCVIECQLLSQAREFRSKTCPHVKADNVHMSPLLFDGCLHDQAL